MYILFTRYTGIHASVGSGAPRVWGHRVDNIWPGLSAQQAWSRGMLGQTRPLPPHCLYCRLKQLTPALPAGFGSWKVPRRLHTFTIAWVHRWCGSEERFVGSGGRYDQWKEWHGRSVSTALCHSISLRYAVWAAAVTRPTFPSLLTLSFHLNQLL